MLFTTDFWYMAPSLSAVTVFIAGLINGKFNIVDGFWPQIEFFSSGGQESRCLGMIQQQPFRIKRDGICSVRCLAFPGGKKLFLNHAKTRGFLAPG